MIKYELIYEHPQHGLIDGGKFDTFVTAVEESHIALRCYGSYDYNPVPFILTKDDSGGTSRVPGNHLIGIFTVGKKCIGRIMPVIV